MDQECKIKNIGITRKECPCIEDLPESMKTSENGYFLHELSGIEEIQTVSDIVNCEDLEDFYQTLIDNSRKEVIDDLSAQISERYSKRSSNFSGVMGSRSHSRSLNIDKDFIGLKIVPSANSDGTIYIKSVGISFDTKIEGFTAELYRYYKGSGMIEKVDEITDLNSSANGYIDNMLVDPVKLPMSIQGEGAIEYYLVIPKEGFSPRNNGSSCGCGGKERRLLSMLKFNGVSGDDLQDLNKWSNQTSNVNGIVLGIEIKCDADQFICSMYQEDSGWSSYFHHALLYKTAYKLHKQILSSKELTQAVLMDRETVANNMNDFESEYWSRIRYLVQNMNTDLTTCYTCNQRPSMGRILV